MDTIQAGKTVCLITPGHISSNPRLVKEATALTIAGYKVHIIFTQYMPYLVDHDQHILNQNTTWTYDCLNWTGYSLSSKISRLFSKLIHSFSTDINIKINRNYYWQFKKATYNKADLYIAHNLGGLPVAVNSAKKTKKKCGFDAEDFHRNEVTNDLNDADVVLKTSVEERYILQLDYMTASSPQISAQYKKLFNRDVSTIINVFPKTDHHEIINNIYKPLQLFWFSQTIGPFRGLETIIEGLNLSNIKADFHLLGAVADDYKAHLISLIKEPRYALHFHAPVYAEDLFLITRQFDIGFASEIGVNLNRTIALTNKIATYVQSGLAVIASNTIAQSAFIDQYPQIGQTYNNAEELADILIRYNNDRSLLYKTKHSSYLLGQVELNWEKERTGFINLINQTINS